MTPLGADLVVFSDERPRKTTAQPQPACRASPHLVEREAAELVEGDAAGERLGRLAEQLGSRAPQHEEASAARLVGQYAQGREQLGAPLHLVDDNQAAKTAQGEHGVVEAREIGGILEVEVLRRPGPLGEQLSRQRRLADLSRSEDRGHSVARDEAG